MSLPVFWPKQRWKTFQLCSEAPCLSNSEHAGTKLPDPALLLDRSQLAQIWNAWLVLTRVRVCKLRMWCSLDKRIFTKTHSIRVLKVVRLVIAILGYIWETAQNEFSAQPGCICSLLALCTGGWTGVRVDTPSVQTRWAAHVFILPQKLFQLDAFWFSDLYHSVVPN